MRISDRHPFYGMMAAHRAAKRMNLWAALRRSLRRDGHLDHIAFSAQYVCKVGHRFTGYPPPGVVVCPDCGTEDINFDQRRGAAMSSDPHPERCTYFQEVLPSFLTAFPAMCGRRAVKGTSSRSGTMNRWGGRSTHSDRSHRHDLGGSAG